MRHWCALARPPWCVLQTSSTRRSDSTAYMISVGWSGVKSRWRYKRPKLATFVNVHPRDLNDGELFDEGAPLTTVASRVVIEISERASLHDVAGLAARLSRLRELGFRIAIDDVGAGYAGLSAFARLEPDFVKLDISLIRNIDLSPKKRSLVKAIANVCSVNLGISVICEGVERSGERDVLVEDGLNLFQGHLFARAASGFPAPTW